MTLPDNLVTAIETELSLFSFDRIKRAREALTHRYRKGLSPRMETPEERVSYLATRMPATLAVLEKIFTECAHTDKTILDLGAGPGTAYWALPEIKSITHIEHDAGLIALGKKLSNNDNKSTWIHGDFLSTPFTPHDIALFSYSFNEVIDLQVIEKAWHACTTLVMIEPGTPRGYQNILKARSALKNLGAHMVAPCPHYNACPLIPPDWCHFATRIERQRWHKELKEGTLGFEDEKYSYLIVTKEPFTPPNARILTPPEKHSGHFSLRLCTTEGVRNKIFSKKEGPVYKAVKKLDWGDSLNIEAPKAKE